MSPCSSKAATMSISFLFRKWCALGTVLAVLSADSVQIEFLNTPREGRPKRSLEDLEKTEQKMRQYFERMYQKVGCLVPWRLC